MAAAILDGKSLALTIKEKIKNEVEALIKKTGKAPKLVSLQVGDNPASEVYLRSQKKTAENLGIGYSPEKLGKDALQDTVTKKITELNLDDTVSGIMVQMPLPSRIDSAVVARCIDSTKDVESVHPRNMGEIVFNRAEIAPCTPSACMELINSIRGLDLYGKEAVVVGHSEIVGKPLALMLLNSFATTTVCHIATGERGSLPEAVKKAEILIVAVGKAGIIKGDWIREGAIVIDVGINRVDGKIVGDVDFEPASKRASYITPVPGGVGPLTVAMLMKNVVKAYSIQNRLKSEIPSTKSETKKDCP